MTSPRSHPIAALTAMVLIWGYSWIAMKIALRHAHPFDFATWRVGLGMTCLFLVIRLTGRPMTLTRYRTAVVTGLLQVALFIGLSHYALLTAGPGKTSVLVFTMPFWMIVFAHYLIGERMRGVQWVAVALAFGGLTLIIAPWELTSLTGSLLAVASGAVWALSAVHQKKWPTPGADPLTLTAWQLLVGFVVLAALSAGFSHEPVRWTTEFVLALAFSGIGGTAIGWVLWTYVLARTPAGITGLNALGIPVVAVLASWAQLGEEPPPLELAGMLLVGLALGLLAWLALRASPRP